MLRHQFPPRIPPPRSPPPRSPPLRVPPLRVSSATRSPPLRVPPPRSPPLRVPPPRVPPLRVPPLRVPPLRVPPPRSPPPRFLRYGLLRRGSPPPTGLLRYGLLRYRLGPSHHVCHVLFTPIPRSLRAVTISVTKPFRNGSPRSIPPSIPTPSDGRSGPVQRSCSGDANLPRRGNEATLPDLLT